MLLKKIKLLVLSASSIDIVELKPNHSSVQVVQENDQVVTFYNEAIQDNNVCIVIKRRQDPRVSIIRPSMQMPPSP